MVVFGGIVEIKRAYKDLTNYGKFEVILFNSVIGFFCVARRCMEPLCLLLMVFVRPFLPLAQRT